MAKYSKIDILVAALSSLFVPGLGQLFQKKYLRAALFFASAAFYYYCPPLAMALHLLSVADAVIPRLFNKNMQSKVLQGGA